MADLDLDGLPDFIISNGYSSSVTTNKGGGVFELGTVELDGHWGSSVALTDFENDGDLDLVKLGNNDWHQGYNYFYLNQADKFAEGNARPSVPTSLTTTFSFGNLNIGWQPSTDDKTPSNLLSYNLWIKDSAGKTWLHGETDATGLFRTRLVAGNVGNRTKYAVRDLPPGTYKIRVQAIDASFASSPWSGEFSVTITQGPTALQVERILLNKVKLSWTGSAFSEQHVILERKSVGTKYEVLAELPAGTTKFVDENLDYNKEYQYRVTEVANGTTTASSNVASWSTLMWIVKETSIPNLYGSLDIADYTQDGKMDILLNGGRNYSSENPEHTRAAFENTGTGWMRHDITPSALSTTASLRFFDVNADHKPDLYQQGYVWDAGYKTEVFLNNGDKTFTPTANEFTQHAYEIQSHNDVDMDNDLDLFVVDRVNGDATKFLRYDGAGNYTTVDPNCSVCVGVVASADFDGDGDEDFIRFENYYYSLYLYTPEGFNPSGVTFPAYDNQIGIFDYNGDGRPDIALLTGSHYTQGKLYENKGMKDGALEFEMIRSDMPSGNNMFNVADFDHDGYQDIALISPRGTFYRNTGRGTFDLYTIPYYTFGGNSGIIDFDNDGDLDVYVTGDINYQYTSSDQAVSRIFLNQTIDAGTGVGNASPSTPVSLSAVQDSLGMHLTWSDAADDHTSATGLTHDIILYRDGKAILKAPIDPAAGTRQRIRTGRFKAKAIMNNLRVGPYTWKVQAVDQSYLGSELSATGSFTFLPPPPLVNDTVIYRCGRNVTIEAKGSDIRWYRDRALTNLIATGEFHPQESQVVYVTQKLDGYEGISRRVVITIHETPPVPMTNSLVTFCENYPANLYLSATGEQIRWYSDVNKNQLLSSTSFLNVVAAERTYYVTQTKQECESEPASVTTSKTVIDTEIYSTNDMLHVKEKNGDYYAWYKNGSFIWNGPSIPYHGETATYYVVVAKDNCIEYSSQYNMPTDIVTAIEDNTDADWSVYPNPASGYFTINVATLRGVVKIYDVTGRLMHTATVDHSMGMTESYSVRMPTGVYLVTFETELKRGASGLLFINR